MPHNFDEEIKLFEEFGYVPDDDLESQTYSQPIDNSPGFLQKPGRSNSRKSSQKGRKHERYRDWD
jgi:hypothetical protein